MLKSDIEWPISRRFKTQSQWEPAGFFSDCLCNARQFDLMLGFFSSSAISVLSDGFASFLYNRGTMRLVINDILTDEDKKAISNGEQGLVSELFDLSDLNSLRETLSERDAHFFECLAWLIKEGRVEIKIVSLKNGSGIAHTKCGIFRDAVNRVGFDGSVNFSRTALLCNKESLTANCDWDGSVSVAKIDDIEDEFKRTFNGEDDSVIYISADEVRTRISNTFGNKEIDQLLKDENDLIAKRLADKELPVTVQYSLKKAKEKVQKAITKLTHSNAVDEPILLGEPKFPYPSGPREYQQKAFENWKANKQKGLFAMATGTGKTLTSLNCLLQISKIKGYYKALILVPTITLVNQWEEECKKFNFHNIVKVCSKNHTWRAEIDRLHFQESLSKAGAENSYIIISTYASFAKDNIFATLNSFSKTKLLFIADEAHNMGSNQIRNKMPAINYLRRIGLSATPERPFDDECNRELFEFFGSEEKFTFEFSMEEAIEKGFLCPYMYYPHLVSLTDSEMIQYEELSKKIARLFSRKSKSREDEDILQTLLLARKRIIHKAVNKLDVFKEIIGKRFEEKGNLQYSLVYVPEGNVPDDDRELYALKDTSDSGDEETLHLIDQYTEIVKNVSPSTTVAQFTASSSNRDEILKSFADGDLEVLTSMKCLDEGVDVPRSEFAVFCASTGNPRQFIQRRGRILRTHKDKPIAIIHDLVVAPCVSYDDPSMYNTERKLIDSELRRVRNFAKLSRNLADSERELHDVITYYNLSIF